MITSKIISNGILRAIGILFGICLLGLFIYKIQSVLIYLFIALALSLIANPIVEFLNRRLKFPNTLAVIVTLFFFICIMAGFIMMFVPLILSQGENLSLLDTNELQKQVTHLLNQINSYFSGHHIDAESLLKESNITSKLNFDFIPVILNSLVGIISGLGIGIGSVIFITFFFLKDKISFLTSAKRVLPDEHEDRILNSVQKINHLLSRYFIGLILQQFVLFILYLIVLLIFGVQNAVIIAFLCALLNIIPYIGPLIATCLVFVLTLLGSMGNGLQADMLSTTLYVMIGFSVAQIIDNNVSQPLIFSNSVNSHPLEIFVVILASGFIFGVLGMVLAIPLYTVLKVIAKEAFPQNVFVQLLTKNI
ncbi:AI-2E family transporter [Flavobacterium sp. '19STA2R22 D10 B1']|uniref:AI-2E family transporter n=1 Tax=Flavobacterium aerium TaxID=3037261 RepID=UPI00278C273C|nr:AI-2E family transporter [Flavobacterium sp. '19STA2R22 D10 B1']